MKNIKGTALFFLALVGLYYIGSMIASKYEVETIFSYVFFVLAAFSYFIFQAKQSNIKCSNCGKSNMLNDLGSSQKCHYCRAVIK